LKVTTRAAAAALGSYIIITIIPCPL